MTIGVKGFNTPLLLFHSYQYIVIDEPPRLIPDQLSVPPVLFCASVEAEQEGGCVLVRLLNLEQIFNYLPSGSDKQLRSVAAATLFPGEEKGCC